MKQFFISFLIFINFSIMAQSFEFGINFGAGNYIGDIGREYYFYPNDIGGGLTLKNTVTPWYSVRINTDYQAIKAFDFEAKSKGRQMRDYSFSGYVLSVSTGIEYYFFPYNPYKSHVSFRVRPYMFTGIGLSSYKGKRGKHITIENDEGITYSGSSFFVPIRLGLKYYIGEHFLISLETGANYYFTDNLDGTQVHYRNVQINDGIVPSTNLNSNDWTTFTSVGLIYTFGDLRCYFNL